MVRDDNLEVEIVVDMDNDNYVGLGNLIPVDDLDEITTSFFFLLQSIVLLFWASLACR